MIDANQNTRQKALALNLDASTYGTFAEIGAGQEVARWFFSVGGAAGTIAKSISAYDMAVSNGLYGPAQRYVSRQRLEAMLKQEFDELLNRLAGARGDSKRFFTFADTTATRVYGKPENGRAWLGIRFQAASREEPSEIILHAHLLDPTAAREQETLGILGVNLIHAAFYERMPVDNLMRALMDGLSREQVEIDMIKLSGPAFAGVDNRLASLQLVEQDLTDAAMFTADGQVVQPSEILYKRPVLVERGTFRPPTRLTLDLLDRTRNQFLQEPQVSGQKPVVLAEMTLRSLTDKSEPGHPDFLARADILGALGYDVLVSRFEAYFQLAEYLARYTDHPVGLALGLPALAQIADEKYYTNLPGGLLEAAGRLFNRSVKIYVYPTRDPVSGLVQTLEHANIRPPWHHLNKILVETGRIVPIQSYDDSTLSIRTPDVLAKIRQGDPSWESMVPPMVAKMVKDRRLFDCQSTEILKNKAGT